MDNEVKKTGNEGVAEYHRLKRVAKGLGIDVDGMNKESLIKAIDANGTTEPKVAPTEIERLRSESVKLGIEAENMDKGELVKAIQRKEIAERVRIEAEEREKLQLEYRLRNERAGLIAESESLAIPIELPEPCTELDLAQARRRLGIKKSEVKPSPETLAIEASKKGYYIFRNLEQDDVDVSCNVGGKHRFDFIPDQVHVLPAWLIGYMRQRAVFPVYGRVPRADGKGEDTKKTGEKQRFVFEFIEDAPQEAEFGVVLDESLKARLLRKELV